MVGVAVKVTLLPAQIVVALALRVTEGDNDVFTWAVIALLVAFALV